VAKVKYGVPIKNTMAINPMAVILLKSMKKRSSPYIRVTGGSPEREAGTGLIL
jgi:hypothetical protein